MTRGEIIKMVKELLGEVQMTPGDGAPMLYDLLINAGADELCEKTDSWWVPQRYSTVAGTADYCADEADPAGRAMIYRIRSAEYHDANGKPSILYDRDIQYMNQYQYGWDQNTANGTPRICIYKGLNRITLWPTPDYSGTRNVTVEGYAKPYQSWPNDTDECPIPGGSSVHMGVAYYVASKRAVTHNKDGDLAQAYNAEYIRIKGQLEKTAVENNDSLRYADIQTKYGYGFRTG